jgi:hypothetical protein
MVTPGDGIDSRAPISHCWMALTSNFHFIFELDVCCR